VLRTYPVSGPNPPARIDMLVGAPPASPQGSRPGVLPGDAHGCQRDQLVFSPFMVVRCGAVTVGTLDLEWSLGHRSPPMEPMFVDGGAGSFGNLFRAVRGGE
jgi:hypothetical protein